MKFFHRLDFQTNLNKLIYSFFECLFFRRLNVNKETKSVSLLSHQTKSIYLGIYPKLCITVGNISLKMQKQMKCPNQSSKMYVK